MRLNYGEARIILSVASAFDEGSLSAEAPDLHG